MKKVIFLAVLIFNFHLSIFKVPLKKYILLSILLAFAASATAQSKDNTVIISGHVVDSAHQDNTIPFVNVAAVQNDSVIAKTLTDFDGFFKLSLPVGEYVLQLFGVGLLRKEIPIIIDKDTELDTIVMVEPNPLYWDEHIIYTYPPAIDTDPHGANQIMEVDGVKVIVR